MHRLGKCHSRNYRLCAYIRKPKKCRFYTCIFIEKGFRKALRTDNFKKKAVFVCTFRADRGKNGQNAHIKSMKKPFSYVRACLRSLCRTGQMPTIPRELNEASFGEYHSTGEITLPALLYNGTYNIQFLTAIIPAIP